jgi:SAM-dependent methyltransferase
MGVSAAVTQHPRIASAKRNSSANAAVITHRPTNTLHVTYSGLDWPYTPLPRRRRSRRLPAVGEVTAWLNADAADTGLPAHSFDAVVSNMGIIFVEPSAQVAEFGRLLTPGGVLGFSSWVADPSNPFRSPIVAVLGPTQEGEYTPAQWGDPDTITTRLAADFETS